MLSRVPCLKVLSCFSWSTDLVRWSVSWFYWLWLVYACQQIYSQCNHIKEIELIKCLKHLRILPYPA